MTRFIVVLLLAVGSLAWSLPVKINQTPGDIPPANQQAWIPGVHVAADGTVVVTYYDFRFNGAGPGALADFWAVRCDRGAGCTDPARWGGEVRLTDRSFDLQRAPRVRTGYFVGDYMGRDSTGDNFLTLFVQPTETTPASIFFRRFTRPWHHEP